MPNKPLELPRIFVPFAAIPGLSLEALTASPIIAGVSVITLGEASGHYAWGPDEMPHQEVIDDDTLDSLITAASAYANGVRVNNGHYSPINEAAGYLTNFRKDGAKLRADLNLFKSYEGFAHLAEIISTVPDTFGLSLDFDRTYEFREDGKAYVRATKIFSCDLVSAPAANRGLFDNPRTAKPMADPTTPAPAAPAASTPAPAAPAATPDIATIIADALKPLVTQIGEIQTKVNELSTAAAASTPAPAAPAATPGAPAMSALRDELAKLTTKVDAAYAAGAGAPPAAATTNGDAPQKKSAYQRNLEHAQKNAGKQ